MELASVKPRVRAAPGEQLLMDASLYHAAVVDDEYLVGALGCMNWREHMMNDAAVPR